MGSGARRSWGGKGWREQPGLLGCTEPHRHGSGVQGTSSGGSETFFKGYIQTGFVGRTVGSACVSSCQHVLSVLDEDGQQEWSTQRPARHPWDNLFPKPVGHSHPRGATSQSTPD